MVMKKGVKISLIVIAVILAILAGFVWFLHPKKSIPEVSTGTLERYPDFESEYIAKRNVSIWLPDNYSNGDSCIVIYMHDGQMLFDADATWNHKEWSVDEVLGQMTAAGELPPCIVVAIDNTKDRLDEYFPQKVSEFVPEEVRAKNNMEPQGDAYLRFVVHELKPFVDAHYRTYTDQKHTFIAGSSMGGLISLYALCEYPEVFSGAVCMSSHLSMAYLPMGKQNEAWAEGFQKYLMDRLPSQEGHRVYMDHGTKLLDADYGPYQACVDSIFQAKGWDDNHYLSLVYEGHTHDEICWGLRLKPSLEFVVPHLSKVGF